MAIVLWNVENGIKKIDRDARMGISALSRSILGSSIIGMDDLSFARVRFTFKYGAKGVIVVYSVKENGWWSCAYYIPFGTEPYMLLK